MDPVNIIITYNDQTKRLEFTSPEKKIDVAYRIINQDSSCFERIEAFFLKHFTRSWVSIGKDNDSIVNINSVAKRTGLKRKAIRNEIKNCNFEDAIKARLSELVLAEAVTDAINEPIENESSFEEPKIELKEEPQMEDELPEPDQLQEEVNVETVDVELDLEETKGEEPVMEELKLEKVEEESQTEVEEVVQEVLVEVKKEEEDPITIENLIDRIRDSEFANSVRKIFDF